MTSKQITPPAALAVSLDDARTAARFDTTDNDAEITLIIKAATAEAEHITGRAFITQSWRVTLDSFPAAIRLDHPPVVAVQSVKYYDADGVLQTLDPADYTVDNVSEPGWVVPAPDVTWPSTAKRVNAVTVDYTVGYGATDASVPDQAKLYIQARVKEQIDPATGAPRDIAPSQFIVRLLDSLKAYG